VRDFAAALSAAQDTRDPIDYVRRVKAVLHDEIQVLDPNAQIEDTNYYSHSAIPDFVITWRREKIQRSVFLRDTLENVVAARDAEFIPDDSPAVITLDSGRTEAPVVEKLTTQMRKRPNALVTSATTLDVIDDKELAEQSPVSELVRANFLRGAKGWVNSDEAELLLNGGSFVGGRSDEEMQAAITKHFQSDAATRISRAATLLALAGRSEWSHDSENEDLFSGSLSDGELRSILPWILKEQPSATSGFWRKFGAMFTFGDLEKLYSELKGYDLTELLEANKATWAAKRAYAGLFVDEEDPADEFTGMQGDRWSFHGRTIGKTLPRLGSRVHIAYSGTKLSGRGASTSTTWEVVEPALMAYRLVRVELKGLRRSVTVNAEESDDIRLDISEIANSLEDTYYVQSVTVRTAAVDEGTVDTQIDFGRSLAVSNGDSSVEDLTRAVRDILIRDV
jgi:hypothetical protein